MSSLWYRPKAKKKNKGAKIDEVLMKRVCLPLTQDLTLFAISTIIGMDGSPKQEGFVLTQLQNQTRAKADVVEVIYDDSPEAIVERLSLAFPKEEV